ncbi:MAG: helix-turn-helix transcriptional regulator [Armatimonadetes bacterium]|nr:helix-turn-helix transcriptional regulator [Armatimonadota bacterium]
MDNSNIPGSIMPDTEGRTDSSCSSIDDKVLNIGRNDKLEVTWGAVISQGVGGCLGEFESDECVTLLFVNKGKLNVRIEDEPFTAHEGQALVILPNEKCIGFGAHQAQLLCQWLNLRIRHRGRRSANHLLQVSRITDVDNPALVTELFRLITEEFQNSYSSSPNTVAGYPRFHFLLLSLLSWLQPSESKTQRPLNALTLLAERAKNYMRTNSRKLNIVTDVANYLECSERYLCEAFRRTYGYSPSKYMLDLRMHRARWCLIETRWPIYQVAEECGYADHRYFDRVFMRENGVTPSEYRIAHSRQHITGGI